MQVHSNFGYGTVSTAPSPANSGTTYVIGTATFADFPDPGTSSPYNVVLWPSGTIPLSSNAEIMTILAKGTNGTINVSRAQESTTARSVLVGDQIAIAITKKSLTDIETTPSVNYLQNGNFINNSTNGYGGTPDDWAANGLASYVQGGFPELTKQQLMDLLGINDGDIEGLWNLSGNYTDLSSNNYTLSDSGHAATDETDGLMTQAKKFASASSQYATGASTNTKIAGSQTFFCFYKPTATTNIHNIMGTGDSDGSKYGAIYMQGAAAIFSLTGLTTATLVTSDVILEAGKWYLLVGVYNGSSLSIFVNGVKKSATASGTHTTPTSNNFSVGRAGDIASNYANGTIQCAGVLSVALTDSQVKRLWGFTSYKGLKLRRTTNNGSLYQDIAAVDVERLRGKTVTLVARMYTDTASVFSIGVFDGVNNGSTLVTVANQWVTVSYTCVVATNASVLEPQIAGNTSDGKVWVKEMSLYEGSIAFPFTHSPKDWDRFPRLLKMDIPTMYSGKPYEYEENRWYTWTPVYTASGSMTFSCASTGKYLISGRQCATYLRFLGTTGGSASTDLYLTVPVRSATTYSIASIAAAMAFDGAFTNAYVLDVQATDQLSLKKIGGNWGIGANRGGHVGGVYEIA